MGEFRGKCCVTPRGYIKPRPGLPQLTRESILHEDIRHLWRTSSAFSHLREQSTDNVVCKDCQIFSTCRGGCRAAAMAAQSSLTPPDPDCWICEEIKGVELHETI
ncbi:MAG: SPASM domain-containing protein [Theionarchaea archaeon]|nr:SPASM domain-containing protein [Theionarchaea archaeon]